MLAFAGLIAAGIIFDWLGVPVLRRLSLGADPGRFILLVDFKALSLELLSGPIIALMILVVLWHWCKTPRITLVGTRLLVAAMIGIAARHWYVPFLAMEARGASIRLIHLWPRTATTLQKAAIKATAIEETITVGGDAPADAARLALRP